MKILQINIAPTCNLHTGCDGHTGIVKINTTQKSEICTAKLIPSIVTIKSQVIYIYRNCRIITINKLYFNATHNIIHLVSPSPREDVQTRPTHITNSCVLNTNCHIGCVLLVYGCASLLHWEYNIGSPPPQKKNSLINMILLFFSEQAK